MLCAHNGQLLSATGMCRFTEDELVDLLGEEFKAMRMFVKSDLMGRPTEVPVPVPPKEGKAIATDQSG